MNNDNIFSKTYNLSQIMIPTLIINAFSFVIALSWNSSIQSLVDYYFPTDIGYSKNVWIKVFTTLFMTILIIFLIVFLSNKLNIDVDQVLNKKF